mmetsp:Transcript_24596/g.45980  ORF Transcript_24596/g.45980 Transcript_24596/m.45980 type:complete len:91 (+) Transcript_24596:513-785(+)
MSELKDPTAGKYCVVRSLPIPVVFSSVELNLHTYRKAVCIKLNAACSEAVQLGLLLLAAWKLITLAIPNNRTVPNTEQYQIQNSTETKQY